MSAAQVASNREFSNLSNNLLSELKTSYPIWEDLIAKTGKFHSSLKLTIQNSSVFLDAVQKVADLATRTYGGSREIGACLTRLCLRQKRLETKLKTMSNHLVTSLANPLTNKLEEWRRTLAQLEKDRTRQTKRARAELKRALSEASRWQKKAAKCGTMSTNVGPGVGHGSLPNSAMMGSKASVVAAQAANAVREVQSKTEQVETAEKTAVRSLMLEERGRFCFFLSCLLPILECQSSMLSEIATIEELIQSLSKAANNPDQLMEDAESILFHSGRGDWSGMSRSSFYMSESDNSSSLIAAATAALFANAGNSIPGTGNHDQHAASTGSEHTQAGSSDTDSGRLTMEAAAPETRRDVPSDNCSLASSTQLHMDPSHNNNNNNNSTATTANAATLATGMHNNAHSLSHANTRCYSMCDAGSLSIGGISSHSSSGGSNTGYGYFSSVAVGQASPGLVSAGGFIPSVGSQANRKSSLTSVHSTASVCVDSNMISVMASRMASNRNFQPADMDETQFQTLCRPGHNRTASVGGGGVGVGGAMLARSDADIRPAYAALKPQSDSVSEANLSLNHQYGFSAVNRPVVDPEWLRACDQANDEDEDDDEEDDDEDGDEDDDADEGSTGDGEDRTRQSSTLINADDEEGGEYVEVCGELNNDQTIPVIQATQAKATEDVMLAKESGGLNSGRHTISSAYERGGNTAIRAPISALSFNPPIGKSSSKDSGVDSSTVLYPNQALPPPVYTNLSQLAQAAQRKFSISHLPSSSVNNSSVEPSLTGDPTPDVAMVTDAAVTGSPLRLAPQFTGLEVTRTRRKQSGSPIPAAANHTSTRHSVSDLAGGSVHSAPQTPMNLSGNGRAVPVQSSRRGTLPSTRPGSNGIDPFSVEMDELDRMVTGSYASMPRLRTSRTSSPVTQRGSTMLTLTASGAIPPDSPYMRSLSPLLLSKSVSGQTGTNPVAFSLGPAGGSQITLASLFRSPPMTPAHHESATGDASFQWSTRDRTLLSNACDTCHRADQSNDSMIRSTEGGGIGEPQSEESPRPRPLSNHWTVSDAGNPPPVSPKPFKLKQAMVTRNRMSLGSGGYGRPSPLSSAQNPPPPPTRRSSFLGSSSTLANAHLAGTGTPNNSCHLELHNGLSSAASLPSSSCASSLTIASSATSESQPSTNGASKIAASTGRRANPVSQEAHETFEPKACGTPNVATGHGTIADAVSNSSLCSSRATGCANQMNESFPHCPPQLYCPPDEVNVSVKPVSSEAAHLMSQLSSQLQQLATRTNEMPLPGCDSPVVAVTASGDGFDLPPPPPASMFVGTTAAGDAQHPAPLDIKQPAGHDALLSALKRSIELRAAKTNARDHSAPSRPT